MAELTCPNFGTGSVDFNAFHEAAKKAKTTEDLEAALAKATEGGPPKTEEDAPVEQTSPTPAVATSGN